MSPKAARTPGTFAKTSKQALKNMTNSSLTLVKKPGPEVMFYFMLNSAELEILNAHKYKNIIIAMRS